MNAQFLVAILVLIIAFVAADLPIHCLASQVAGKWEFELSAASHSSPDLCGYSQPDKSRQHLDGSYTFKLDVERKVGVSMTLPQYSSTLEGKTGTWTMVYDEGFNVLVGDYDFFAFHEYKPKAGFSQLSNIKPENYDSFCDKTLIGWYKKGNKFGCWRGSQVSKQFPLLKLAGSQKTATEVEFAVVSPTALIDVSASDSFHNDHSFIDAHNQLEDRLWEAAAYEQFENKSMTEMKKLAGGDFNPLMHSGKANVESDLTSTEEDLYMSFLDAGDVNKADDEEKDEEKDEEEEEPATAAAAPAPPKTCEFGLPCELDWRRHKGQDWVGEIRNQGSCGSCYAMAFTSSLDIRARIKHNDVNYARFSPQEVVSCSVYNQGCDGGFPYLVGKHMQHFGAVHEKCFPYEARDGVCRKTSCAKEYPVADCGYIGGHLGAATEELIMKDIFTHGPIIAGFEAPRTLFSYKSGIFTGPQARKEDLGVPGMRLWSKTNHAVMIVGWGHDVVNGKRVKFWMVRNSWGKEWGLDGYFKIRRGTDECGIENVVTYVHAN